MSRSSSRNFKPHTGGKGADFIWKFGVRSPSERKTKILSFKIDPEDPAGAGRGPYRERLSGISRPLTGLQNQPESIPAIEGYDALSRFYT